jgi:hypothetical protein
MEINMESSINYPRSHAKTLAKNSPHHYRSITAHEETIPKLIVAILLAVASKEMKRKPRESINKNKTHETRSSIIKSRVISVHCTIYQNSVIIRMEVGTFIA